MMTSLEKLNENLANEKLKSNHEKLKSNHEKLKANDEKLKASIEMMTSLEKLNENLANEKLNASIEKIASLEKLMDEKINSAVQKSVNVAIENFLQYPYWNEYKDMREKQAKQSIVSKDDDISSDISDDSKNKTKE